MGNNPSSEVPPSPTVSISDSRPSSPIPPGSTGITIEEQKLGEDMNKKDYRKYSSDPDLHPDLRRLSKSVGAVLAVDSLVDGPNGGLMIRTIQDFKTVAGHANAISENAARAEKREEVLETVYNAELKKGKSVLDANQIALKAVADLKVENFPRVPKNYKFADNLCLAPINYHRDKSLGGLGTVFHLGNGIIASDGHVFFNKKLTGLCVVFDLTQEYLTPPNPNEKKTMKYERIEKKRLGDKVITEELEILNEIPRENVFFLERIVCGQEAVPNLLPQDSIDKLDWILLELKPGKGQKFPEALRIMPPQKLLSLGVGPSPIFTIGHTWGTSAKVSNPSDGKYRMLTNNCWDKQTKAFTAKTLENTLVHNLMIRVGNSGGPIFYNDVKDGPLVIATQGSLFNPGDDTLTKFGFQCPSGFKDLNKPTYLGLTEPDSPFNWSTATKTSAWSYLLDTESRVNLLCVADVTSNPGTMEFVLFIRTSNREIAACKIGSFQVGPNICNARKFSKPFNSISSEPGLTPTCIIGLGVIFTPGGLQAQAPTAPIIKKWVNQGSFGTLTLVSSSTGKKPIPELPKTPSALSANIGLIRYLALYIEGKNDTNRLSRIVLGRRSKFEVTKRVVFGTEGVWEDSPETLPAIKPDSGWFVLDPNWRDDVEIDEVEFLKLKIPVIDENTKS